MAECTSCDASMQPKSTGIRALLSLSSLEGYECSGCGATLCPACKREMEINTMGGSAVSCSTCGGEWERR